MRSPYLCAIHRMTLVVQNALRHGAIRHRVQQTPFLQCDGIQPQPELRSKLQSDSELLLTPID